MTAGIGDQSGLVKELQRQPGGTGIVNGGEGLLDWLWLVGLPSALSIPVRMDYFNSLMNLVEADALVTPTHVKTELDWLMWKPSHEPVPN